MTHWTNTEKNRVILADVIVKIWQDTQYKAMFIAEPKKVLQAAGIEDISEETELQIIENTPKRQYFVLPDEFSTDYGNEITASMQALLPLSPGQEIVFVQNTTQLQYISLPIPPEYESDSLSQEELELVSGGAAVKTLVVASAQVLVAKQALVAVNAAVLAKTKVTIRG